MPPSTLSSRASAKSETGSSASARIFRRASEKVRRINLLQLAFVFIAFFLMVAASYVAVRLLMSKYLFAAETEDYKRDLLHVALILTALGATMMGGLMYMLRRLQRAVFTQTRAVTDLQIALVNTMSELVAGRDGTTGGHIKRTQHGFEILARALQQRGIYAEETASWHLDSLPQSSQLHDIGKIFISDAVLKKPCQLTRKEFAQIREHTLYGAQVIEKIQAESMSCDFLRYAKIFAETHHERWDGSGYPHRLAGTAIPLLGRVIAIADVYDALTADRPYKKAFTHREAVEIIQQGSGKHFDPKLVEVFSAIAKEFRKIPQYEQWRPRGLCRPTPEVLNKWSAQIEEI